MNEESWDSGPATGWSIEDLDEAEIGRTVEEAVRRGRMTEPETRKPPGMLRALGLLVDDTLRRAGVVLFGRAERLIVPQCLCARIRGRSEHLDDRRFNGNIFTLLEQAERFLLDTLPIAGRFEAGRFDRIDEPLYPPLATREALVNAFCHQDYALRGGLVNVTVYDDRLEVVSSGVLASGLSPERLFASHEHLPPNPRIARALYLRGIIEARGCGILRMTEWTSSAGQPRPEFVESDGVLTARFRRGRA